MLDSIFASAIVGAEMGGITPLAFAICMGSALVIGFMISVFYTIHNQYTKSFVMTLCTLPCAVAMVIIMVNGSVGVGVAVAGAFSLIRFRSVPGTAKEISAIFLAMGAGLAVGLGYVAFAFVYALFLSCANMALAISSFGEPQKNHRTLLITMPEHLDYGTVFQDIFQQYTLSAQLVAVKTTSMGSLFKLSYDVTLAKEEDEKAFLDELRCRNGNLEISLTKQSIVNTEL
ncbi:MAG: DUF4956 domain-containing protein [Eubacteriales bacterium]